MLGRLSSLFHQAAEFSSQILADTTDQDEFKEHWKIVTGIITDNGPIIALKEKFEVMLKLLSFEEDQLHSGDPGIVGPCLEFLLRHKILDTLFTAASNNHPPGIDRQVLNFFTVLLGQLERPLLHHVSIHQPVLLQVTCCGDDPSGPLCIHQIHFLQILCVRLNKDPRLADFFMKENEGGKEFVLLKALLRLSNSSDGLVVMKSYECLLACASLQHSSVTTALTTGHLPVILASKLQYHFQLIPPNVKHSVIWSCKTAWGSVTTSDHSESGIWHVEAFFSWLDYCGQVIAASQASLGRALCESVHEVFLSTSLLPKLLKAKEEEILTSTSVLAHSIQVIRCNSLSEEFVRFALKESCKLDIGEPNSITIQEIHLLDQLICRINHNSEDVCRVTLQLFDVLFRSPFLVVFEALTDCQSIDQHCIVHAEIMRSARLQLEENIISYLSLIPDYISSHKNDEFSCYLREAHSEVARKHYMCRCAVDGSKTSKSGNPIFIDVLLNKLELILDQPYEINLLVASLFAQLAAAPYPSFTWLFQPKTQQRNVYTILKKVTETFSLRVERTPGLVVHIVEARRRLEGQPTSDLLSMPHNDLLEGAIALEEFIKELCSIIYAKTSWSILALPT